MLKQAYSNYTVEEHKTWSVLYSRVMQFIPEAADEAVLTGLRRIGYPSDQIPDFKDINERLNTFTDWEIVPMEEMVGDAEFISMLAEKKYPCRTWIRDNEKAEAEQDEYDVFHDIIGHTPLLTIPNYCYYLQGLGKLALEYINNDDALLLLKRIYWHTIQFGIKTAGSSLKIYGAHLISSKSETAFSLGAGVPKYDFNISKIMETPYVKNKFQERYFVIDNYEELYNSLPAIKEEVKKRVGV